MAGKHTWRFFRAGGFDQVRIDTGADIAALGELDQKLWVALACPTRGIEFDIRTLDLIDTDNDGRIRAPEIIAAAQWACAMVVNPDLLVKGGASLPLEAISEATAEGKALKVSAKQILVNLGKADMGEISIEDVGDTARIFAQTRFNGDGVVPADAAEDAGVQGVITDIITCVGSDADRSGKVGVSQAKVDQFFAEAAAHMKWWDAAEADKAVILPLGEATAAGAALLAAANAKIEDYFARCRLAAFDSRATAALNREENEYLTMAVKDLTITSAEIGALPLAKVEASKPLPLTSSQNSARTVLARLNTALLKPLNPALSGAIAGLDATLINPAWADAIAELNLTVIKPLLGDKDALTDAEWLILCGKLAPFAAWQAGKPVGNAEKLPLARVREILAGNAKAAIDALIAKDKALEPEALAITGVNRLLHYVRDLHRLLNNYVAFRAFYGRKEKAVFQAGTLYLDQRSCEFSVQVADMAKHGIMAHLSRAYLVYCELTHKATGEKMTVLSAMMDGDSDNLMVGRNGIFYDRRGVDWDATIVKIVDNPISIRQAFWAPYKRAMRWIEDQIAKRAAAADAASTDRLTAAAVMAENATKANTPAARPKLDIGVVAAIGVAVGGITAALGAILQAFFGLGIWMPLGLIALILLISGPSMIIAWLKLRQRNLGPILDANGWAVNARAKINIPFGKSLTPMARMPAGSVRDLTDPYAQSQAGRYKFAALVIVVIGLVAAWYFGAAEQVMPGVLPKSGFVLRREAAAEKAKADKEAMEKVAAQEAGTQAATGK